MATVGLLKLDKAVLFISFFLMVWNKYICIALLNMCEYSDYFVR